MIFDLFPHVLSTVCPITKKSHKSLEQELKNVKLSRIIGAQAIDAPIIGETFAKIDFIVEKIKVNVMLGKYINTCDSKFMKIYGSNGQIKFNFLTSEFFIFDYKNNKKSNNKLNQEHVESFLNKVLKGKNPLSIPGVLNFSSALEILLILDEAKMSLEKMPKYKAKSSIEEAIKEIEKT
jgi:hypothetical protein